MNNRTALNITLAIFNELRHDTRLECNALEQTLRYGYTDHPDQVCEEIDELEENLTLMNKLMVIIKWAENNKKIATRGSAYDDGCNDIPF